jgi:hypothetical protein
MGQPRFDDTALSDTSEFLIQADRLVAASNDLEILRHSISYIRSVMLGFLDRDMISDVAPARGSTNSQKRSDSILIGWLMALRSARRLAAIAGEHAFEWAAPAGPLGSTPGGMIEIATEQQFAERCDAEITRVEAELQRRANVRHAAMPDLYLHWILPAEGSVGLKQAADWDLLSSIEGFSINLQSGELNLTTPIPGNWRALSAPVFSATFVGRTEFKPTAHGGALTLRIGRTITLSPIRSYLHRAGATGGVQLIIRTMRVAGPPPISDLGGNDTSPRALDVRVSLGPNPVGCTVTREASGTLLLSFASPLTLLTGDLLQVNVQ